jgi:Type II CAAX prenyl endopeptidase Rce1-like
MTRAAREAVSRSRRELRLLVGFVVVLAGAEVLIGSGHVLAGQIFDAIVLVLLVNVGSITRWNGSPNCLAALRGMAVLAAVRVASIGLPLRTWSVGVSSLVIAALAIFAVMRAAPILDLSRRALFAPSPIAIDLLAVATGLAMGYVAYKVGAPSSLHPGEAGRTVAVSVTGAVALAIAEELVYRGAVQCTAQRVAPRFGLVAATALFALSYLGFRNASLVLAMALSGVVFAYTVAHREVLGAALLGHVALALGTALIWPAAFGDDDHRHGTPSTTIALAVALVVTTTVVLLTFRKKGSVESPNSEPPHEPTDSG